MRISTSFPIVKFQQKNVIPFKLETLFVVHTIPHFLVTCLLLLPIKG